MSYVIYVTPNSDHDSSEDLCRAIREAGHVSVCHHQPRCDGVLLLPGWQGARVALDSADYAMQHGQPISNNLEELLRSIQERK